jgi:hypothetical protein
MHVSVNRQFVQLELQSLSPRYDTRLYQEVSGLSHNEIYALPLVLLVEKQHKGLWRQNSLD